MNAQDGDGDLIPRTIPELIKHLWDIYMTMSLDPALASSADKVRQAALDLEQLRRMAYEVLQEEDADRSKSERSKRSRTNQEEPPSDWLKNIKTPSHLKH